MGGRSREQQRQQRQNAIRSVKHMPLTAVLASAGLQQDRSDKNQFISDGHRIAVTGDMFYDFEQGKGGKGAIDLQIHLQQSNDFDAAIEKLSGVDLSSIDVTNVTQSQSQPKPPSAIPKPSDTTLPARDYLINQRGIDSDLLKPFVESGQIYADDNGNVVFKYGDSAAELRGTRGEKFRGLRGSVESGFVVAADSPKAVVVVESAIDALSYRQLHGNDYTVIALAGNSNKTVMMQAIETAKSAGVPVVSAFDNDSGGAIAQANLTALATASGVTVNVQKPKSKDWNDDLQIKNKRDSEISLSRWDLSPVAVKRILKDIKANDRRVTKNAGVPVLTSAGNLIVGLHTKDYYHFSVYSKDGKYKGRHSVSMDSVKDMGFINEFYQAVDNDESILTKKG